MGAGAGGKGASAPGGTPAPSSRAMENSNGRFIQDREFGRERAAERHAQQQKAAAAQKKRRLPPEPPLPPELLPRKL